MDIHLLNNNEVKERLRSSLGAILIKEGMTMCDMSELIGITPSTMSYFLKNDKKHNVGIKSMMKIAHFVGGRGYDLEKIIV